MAQPLMPKATAVWLVENTTLTFRQIAEFCGLHELEVQAIADGEVAGGMQGLDPVASGQLAKEEIAKGQADSNYRLQLAKPSIPLPEARTKGARYTPVAKRSDRPDAIAWLLKNHPELADAQITKLVGTTKNTIQAVRDRSHWNTPNIRPQSPVLLGLCSNDELEKAVHRARERLRRASAEGEAPAAVEEEEKASPQSVP
ncbi:MAG TPA: cell cycle transcriptional regulator TrcR [Alphaproteobacteria bacterium]|nr:cell cycle transcriptional regulator TrcR [Alphaproteobacteria bacterium]